MALATLTCALLVHGLLQRPRFVDPSSVAVGTMLRRGELDSELRAGTLLVERVEPRPPMGWASLSVLWSRWHRTVFLTRRGDTCELVEPTDVVEGRARIPCVELRDWCSRRGVTAAWVLSASARELLRETWPRAGERRIGDGSLFSTPSAHLREAAPR